MRPLFFSFALLASAGAVRAVEPAAPSTRGQPPAPPAFPIPKVTLAQFLDKLPGTWAGEQRMRNPKGEVMTMRVTESYRWETRDGARVLVGELTYTVGSGDKAKTFKGASLTRIDAAGKGRAEVTDSGKTLRYDALISEDTLVFVPEGKGAKAESGTGVSFVKEGDAVFLSVRGFQTGPDGVYLVEGKLRKLPDASKH